MSRSSKFFSILAVAFALALSVALAGCGQQASSAASSAASASSSAASSADSASATSAEGKISYTLKIDATEADKGVIYDSEGTADKGETVYQVLLDTNLPLEVAQSSGSAYVTGIGDVVVTDKTPTAGWLFTVNGKTPSVGADQVEVSEGDEIVWTYYEDATKAM